MEDVRVESQTSEAVSITEDMVAEFVDFLKNKEDYLDTGLGAFHTDNHGNW